MGLWDIDKIEYVGRGNGPVEGLGFQYYDADKVVAGKKMKDWLRFGVAWWCRASHIMRLSILELNPRQKFTARH